MPMGKYKGQLISEVVYADPQYVEWLIGQAELLRRHPTLERGLADLGTSGDETPIHNAVQAYFLDDKVCARLLRRLWGDDVRDRYANAVLGRSRREGLAELVGPRAYYETSGHRRTLLGKILRLRRDTDALTKALLLDDEQLEALCRSSMHPSPLSIYPISSAPRAQIQRQLSIDGKTLQATRDSLIELRRAMVECRLKFDSITVSEIRKSWKQTIKRFEETNGSDLHLTYTLECSLPGSHYPDEVSTFDIWTEIKPFLGDDYPSTIRQMELQRRQAAGRILKESRFVLLIGKFGARGVTLEQLRAIFAHSKFDVVTLAELGCELPKLQEQPVQSLSLFG